MSPALLLSVGLALGVYAGSIVWYLVLGPIVTVDGPTLVRRQVSGAYPTGDLLFAVVLGASVFLLAAARQRAVTAPAELSAVSKPRPDAAPPRQVTWLSYFAPLVILGLLVDSQLHASFFSRLSLTITAVVVMLLVVLRQGAAQRQLLSALRVKDEAETRYRTLVEELPLITYIDLPHSTDEAAAYVSPQIESMLGYSTEEWFSRPSFFVEHLHPEDSARVRALQNAARETGEPLELEYRFLAKDGTYVWLADSYSIVLDDEELPWYSQGFALDVTARKQAEHDREALLAQAQAHNAQLDEAQRERTRLLARTVEVAEHERMRIAAELHDGPIQKLTAVAFNLDRLALRIARNEQGVAQLVGAIRTNLQDEMSSLRRLMSELRPPILDQRNLAAALNDCAGQAFADAPIHHETRCSLGNEPLAPEVETAVYRVVREALINVRRHAGATHVQIDVERIGDSLRLLVADDGKGFDSSTPEGGHYGLLSMQERIGSVGGRLEVASAAGTGTRIQATLPWKARAVAPAAA